MRISIEFHELEQPVPIIQANHLSAMRSWASECEFLDADFLEDYTDHQIIRGIRKHYAGGVPAFLETCL